MDEKQLKDEQELAKVLAGINNDDSKAIDDESNPDDILKSFNNQGAPKPIIKDGTKTDGFDLPDFEVSQAVKNMEPITAKVNSVPDMKESLPIPSQSQDIMPKPNPSPTPTAIDGVLSGSAGELTHKKDLETIKKEVINDIKPLVDKLELHNDEKFDTYLLLIRSTDDENLIGPAYDVAKKITDEKKRAQALLDIIKEINYFSSPKK